MGFSVHTMEARETRLAVRNSDLPQICKANLGSVIEAYKDEAADMRSMEQDLNP